MGARPYGFKNLYPSKKPATVTQQLQKSIDFRRIELYDFHLWIESGLLYKGKCIQVSRPITAPQKRKKGEN
jgi:hypothetical protein